MNQTLQDLIYDRIQSIAVHISDLNEDISRHETDIELLKERRETYRTQMEDLQNAYNFNRLTTEESN